MALQYRLLYDRVSLERLYVSVDPMEFGRNIYRLRTVRRALIAAYTVTRLAKSGHGPVIADKECSPGLGVILVLTVLRHIPLVHALVVVKKYGRNIDTVGAWHAVLAVVAGHSGILHHQIGSVV